MKEHRFSIAALLVLVIVTLCPFWGIINTQEEQPTEEPVILGMHIQMDFKSLEESCIGCIPEKPVLPFLPDVVVWYTDTFKLKYLDHVTIPTVEMKLTSLGTYYITGYTSIECGGSTMTASGATCHRADYEDRLTIPTTCAIDPKLHDFGDLFYIPAFDRVFVAEDTGSAVKGKHLDLYYLDDQYSEALAMTGYYEVYSVEYVYGSVQASKYDICELVWKVQNGYPDE